MELITFFSSEINNVLFITIILKQALGCLVPSSYYFLNEIHDKLKLKGADETKLLFKSQGSVSSLYS